MDKAPQTNPDSWHRSEPALGPHQVQASCHRSSGPNTGSNSGGRWIKKYHLATQLLDSSSEIDAEAQITFFKLLTFLCEILGNDQVFNALVGIVIMVGINVDNNFFSYYISDYSLHTHHCQWVGDQTEKEPSAPKPLEFLGVSWLLAQKTTV